MKTEYDFFKEEVIHACQQVGKNYSMTLSTLEMLIDTAKLNYHEYLQDLPDEIADIPEDLFDPIP